MPDGGRALRCELCGEVIGTVLIEQVPIDPEIVVARCYSCAATEEAEAITQKAAQDA